MCYHGTEALFAGSHGGSVLKWGLGARAAQDELKFGHITKHKGKQAGRKAGRQSLAPPLLPSHPLPLRSAALPCAAVINCAYLIGRGASCFWLMLLGCLLRCLQRLTRTWCGPSPPCRQSSQPDKQTARQTGSKACRQTDMQAGCCTVKQAGSIYCAKWPPQTCMRGVHVTFVCSCMLWVAWHGRTLNAVAAGDSLGGVTVWDAQFGTVLQHFPHLHKADVLALAVPKSGAEGKQQQSTHGWGELKMYAAGMDGKLSAFTYADDAVSQSVRQLDHHPSQPVSHHRGLGS